MSPVQKKPSVHVVPSAFVCASQASVVSLQMPLLHTSPATLQSGALPATQSPPPQVSAPLQCRPSSHKTSVPSSTPPMQLLSLSSQSSGAPSKMSGSLSSQSPAQVVEYQVARGHDQQCHERGEQHAECQ